MSALEIPTQCDNEEQARACLAWFVDVLGLGFHPDTRGADYVNRDGSRVFNDAQAAAVDALLDRILAHVDPYDAGVEEMRKQGLI